MRNTDSGYQISDRSPEALFAYHCAGDSRDICDTLTAARLSSDIQCIQGSSRPYSHTRSNPRLHAHARSLSDMVLSTFLMVIIPEMQLVLGPYQITSNLKFYVSRIVCGVARAHSDIHSTHTRAAFGSYYTLLLSLPYQLFADQGICLSRSGLHRREHSFVLFNRLGMM